MIITSISLIIVGAFIGYSKSKYFPLKDLAFRKWTLRFKKQTMLLTYLLHFTALILLCSTFDVFTGMIYWLTCLMLMYSILVIVVPVLNIFQNNKR